MKILGVQLLKIVVVILMIFCGGCLNGCFIGDSQSDIYISNDTNEPFEMDIRSSYFYHDRAQKMVNKEYDSIHITFIKPGEKLKMGSEINGFKIHTSNMIFDNDVKFKWNQEEIHLVGDTLIFSFVSPKIENKDGMTVKVSSLFR